jgi:hypothetical protein
VENYIAKLSCININKLDPCFFLCMTPRGRRVPFRALGASLPPSVALSFLFKSHEPRDYHLRPFITLSFLSNITFLLLLILIPNHPNPNSFSSKKNTKNMSRATVELDFFGMEKESSSKSQFQKFLDRQRSYRGRFDSRFLSLPLHVMCYAIYA